jgi:glycosyltransferase involved in cell wall biosynthesis
MSTAESLSIILPAKNEAATIGDVVTHIRSHLGCTCPD